MHEKTAVSSLIEELYTFLRQADSRELDLLFTALDAAREAGDSAKAAEIQNQIDNYETHIVRSSPTSTLASVTRKPPTCWPSA
jgi:hypothetical protein